MISRGESNRKTCTKCGIEKHLHEYSVKRRTAAGIGLHSYCKACGLLAASMWQKNNPQKRKALKQRSRNKNIEKIRADDRQRNKRRRTRTPHLIAAWNATRRAARIRATPCWANFKEILIEYELARWCTEVMGEKYEVDHIVPLNGKNVCGLHVQNNLQVIRGTLNRMKGNLFEIEEETCTGASTGLRSTQQSGPSVRA